MATARATASKKGTRVQRLDDGDWLYRLLEDIQGEVASQPSRQAIERVRRRLQLELEAPSQTAAAA